MFQVVAAPYWSGSIVLTTNRASEAWARLFDDDNTQVTAMIDRSMHAGEALVILEPPFA
jgi:DNA replication protein DnaC